MLHPSTKRLLDKLSEMTGKQKVGWQEGENGAVTHDTEGYRVTLTPVPCSMILTDALGREIESCSPHDYADDQDGMGRPFSQFIEDLYREAHRNARGAEKAISAVLAGLDKLPEDTPEPEPELPVVQTETDPSSQIEDAIEDPLDDSDPLDADMYPELEGQSDITTAVASLADQVNGQHQVEFIDEAETEDTAAVPAEAEALEPVEADEAVTDTELPDVVPDLPAPDPYIPAFTENTPDAPAYTQSEAVGSFEARPSEPAGYEESDAIEVSASDEPLEMPTEAVFEVSAEDEYAAETGLAEPDPQTEETGSEPTIIGNETTEPDPLPDPEPAQRGNFLKQGYFGGGYGSSLSQYKPESTTQTSEAPQPEQDAEPESPAYAESPEPDTEEQTEEDTKSSKSFSLSGITSGFGLGSSGRSSKEESDPGSETDPVSMGEETQQAPPSDRKIIDGTVDLQDWVPDQQEDVMAEEPDPEPTVSEPVSAEAEVEDDVIIESATPVAAPEPEPEPDVVDTASEEQDTETPSEDTPPPRPTKRFNPWN